MINTLASRPAYAKVLLAAVRDKKIAPSEISAYHARQIRGFDNAELTAGLAELWGDVRVSAAEKQSLIDRYKSELSAATISNADLSAGRAVFQKTCANCHVLYGAGRKVGPDLTGSNRKNIDYLLENIVDPSASVGADFRVLVVTLADGRVLSGVVSEQNERTLTLQTPQEPVTIDRTEIEESKQSTSSLMPDGQLQNLSAEQIRDLVGYLMSSDQVPLPK
jgi:putative heme-binding domain-containing protein